VGDVREYRLGRPLRLGEIYQKAAGLGSGLLVPRDTESNLSTTGVARRNRRTGSLRSRPRELKHARRSIETPILTAGSIQCTSLARTHRRGVEARRWCV